MQSLLRFSTKLTFCLCLAAMWFSLTTRQSQAAGDFSTSLQTTITINEVGQSRVEHLLKITNRNPTALVQRVAFQIASPNLNSVTVTEQNLTVPAQIVTTNSHTSIGINFPEPVVGEGKSREVLISYPSPDMSTVAGQVLEINVPPLLQPENYDSYSIVFKTPKRFGQPTRVQPTSQGTTSDDNYTITSVSPTTGEAATILFGSSQTYQFSLEFPLINSTAQPSLIQLALPPDTAYQQVKFEQLSPTPTQIKSDDDGNWIASYELPANTHDVGKVTGKVAVTLEPNVSLVTPSHANKLTSSQLFWETTDGKVREKSDQLALIHKIYEDVVKNLHYNSNLVPQTGDKMPQRLGAAASLAHPDQVTCLEFTDTFIALARAQGIPARRIVGYVNTSNQVLRPGCLYKQKLHVWPEHYDQIKNSWIPSDPTWQHTTGGVDFWQQLDLNHITLAINGGSSEQPLPVALSTTSNPTLAFEVATRWPEVTQDITIKLQPVTILGIPIPGKYHIVLTNHTGLAWHHLRVQPSATNSQIEAISEIETTILPFQSQEVPLTILSNSWFKPEMSQLQLSLNHENSASFAITTVPKYTIALVIGGIGLALGAGSVLVFRRHRHRTLRR